MTPKKKTETLSSRQSFDEYQLLEELETRKAELSILNSIQEGLASGLDIDTIFELAGERIAEIFPGAGIALYTFNSETMWGEAKYILEDGVRHYPPPFESGPIGKKAAATKQPLVISTRAEFEAIGATTIEGTAPSLSGVYTPLIVNDKPVGALNIESTTKEHAFDDADIRLVTTIARSLSVALENARLLKETEERNAELIVINSIQDGLASNLEIDGIFEMVGERISEMFPGHAVVFYTYDEEADLAHSKFMLERGVRHHLPPIQPGSFAKIFLESKEPMMVSTLAEFNEMSATTIEGTAESLSGIYTPLVAQGKVIGGLHVENPDKEHAFTDGDLRLISTIASSMSVALENVRLFNETEQRAQELVIINGVQSALAAKLEMQAIYDEVGDTIHAVFSDAQVVDILNYDASTQLFHPRYVIEREKRYDVDPWPARGFRKHVVETGQSMVINENMEEMAQKYDNDWVVLGEFAKAMVVVPMKVGDEVTGVMSLQHLDQENAFSESDVRLLETLAASMSVALENARLFNETEERNAELAIINTVQRALSAELDIQGIYEAVGEKLRQIFDSQTIAIYSADLKTRINTTAYAYEKGQKFEPVSIPFSSLHDHLIELNDTYVFNGNFPEFAAQFKDYKVSAGEMPKSLVGVPVSRGKDGGTIVTLTLQDIDGDKFFDEGDVRLLETLANSMSVALENARLFDETQHLLEETEVRAAELATINTVGQALVAESELDALIELIGEKMRETFAADIVYVALLEQDSDVIHFPYTYGEEFDSIQLGEGLTSTVIRSNEPLLINKEMDKRRAEMGVTQVGVKARSYLGVPIQIGEQTFGVISVQSTSEEGRFTESDLHLLSTIAANVGAALRNAQLFDQIKRQKQYYEAVIENSPAAIVLLDMETNVTGWNPAAERLFGYTEAEALHKNIDDLVAFSDELHAEAVRYSEKAQEEKSVHLLTRRTRKDGSLVEVEVSGLPVSVDGEYVGFIAIYHDVTELQRARQDAEEANRAKSSFLANMSHELRTPLNAIIGFSRIVRRKGKDVLPKTQVENLDKVLVSADHLLNLINTVLDISKIESGRMDVQTTTFELPPLVDLVIDSSQPLLRKGVSIKTDLQPAIPEMLSDQDKLKQILLNLISNAAKFTHEGEITLASRHDGERLYVDVNDTGIGVSEDALARIFEDFQQADTSTTREYGGTGLGLPISRSLARLLGGDLTACSIEGEGSTFTLTIPLHYSEILDEESAGVAVANR